MGFPESDAERAWTAILGVAVVALVGGSLAFPDRVYGGFVWHYFWGPVYADAHSAACVVWDGGARTLLYENAKCAAASGIVAEPGYTLVSEAGYALTLVFMLTGVVFLIRRLDVGEEYSLLYALFPFMLFGGALRVVEDADDTVPTSLIHYPLNALIISPVIYVTVFALTLVALLLAVWLARTGRTAGYERPLFAFGTGLLALTLAYLCALVVTDPNVSFHPVFTILTYLIAGAVTAADYWLLTRHAPGVLSGSGIAGVLVIFGHAIDGASNVLGLDFGKELGLPYDLTPKHPVNRFIVRFTEGVLPHSVTDAIGAAWPFLLVKIVAATFVVSLFDAKMYEENPRYTVLLLVAVLAVGLGPGTRDMLRATFGV
ncbi:hypothetical protein MBEHAL_0148 [Halarchaeum acidiphilum MH1-52-1]|uniref:DUF63 family protein n=1 Tax=Halarchaeum acidiphilum MH1-52-1 TaxID=1261545 RepID=U3A9G0_9EURY|nr:DUF63 family protein [Halarchaeum acidiphilum]GAD51388.1 hypothetical protein MBEHAL_0148 [Halarchaeum acidiphilum MH1-52-1]